MEGQILFKERQGRGYVARYGEKDLDGRADSTVTLYRLSGVDIPHTPSVLYLLSTVRVTHTYWLYGRPDAEHDPLYSIQQDNRLMVCDSDASAIRRAVYAADEGEQDWLYLTKPCEVVA